MLKKKKEIDITCLLCRHYGNAKLIHTGDSSIKKLCKEKGIEVRHNSDKCELFELSNWFYCIKEERRISLDICWKSYKRGYGCKTCNQGLMIDKIMKGK